MFLRFFLDLRDAQLPVSLTEYLTLLDAMTKGAAGFSTEHFYYLSRACLVKDERHIDRFDRVFSRIFHGFGDDDIVEDDDFELELPADWLTALAERLLSDEEKAQVKALGGLEALVREMMTRLSEQHGRHEGGSKWIGTAGTSPFGGFGFHPEGMRVGQPTSRHRKAAKVWDRREFRNFADDAELNTRGFKLALRRLRRFARQGAASELDLNGTIDATARQGGMLDLHMVPERHNAVKVLLFLDVGGSMDDHVALCEQLFSAARSEFKHLEHYYFHNCVYDAVWRDNRRRHQDIVPMEQILRTYAADYRLVIVGDAAMSPFELREPGGGVETWTAEPGEVWLERMLEAYPRAVWLNPLPFEQWAWTTSVGMIVRLLNGRMFPLTLEGLDAAMRELSH
jgi:uncharacterized protein with von Willebrand factor type A (vWA) domain